MEKIIRVTGRGEFSLAPDTIEVGLVMRALNKNYEKSLSEVNEKVEAVKQAVIKAGVEEKNILTNNFSVYPRTRSVKKLSGYEEEFAGFETTHNLIISFDYDTIMLGNIIDSLSNAIAEPRLSIGFKRKNTDGIKEQLLKDAVSNAKCDAESLAMAAGVKLGEVLCINHSFQEVYINSPRNYDMAMEELDFAHAKKASIGSSLSNINVGDIKYQATATIDYKID